MFVSLFEFIFMRVVTGADLYMYVCGMRALHL